MDAEDPGGQTAPENGAPLASDAEAALEGLGSIPAEVRGERARPSGDATGGLDFVLDVPLKVTVEIGGARMLVREVLQLGKGSIVELDRVAGEPADVLVNERLVARGEVTVIDDRLAVKVVEVVENHSDRVREG